MDKKGKLTIGISSCFFHADPERAIFKGKTLLYLEESMARWAMSEGALAYLIPRPSKDKNAPSLSDLLAPFDGLLLQGGSDLSPKSYGEAPIKPEWSGDYERDQYEIALVRECLKLNKPILGICRGAQLINVAFGGTLYQDIEAQVPSALNHRNWEIYDQNFHQIVFEKNSALSSLYPGIASGTINTVHHQAIKDLGKDLIIEAKSETDHLIEAIRLKSDTHYCVAVQWHPEFQDPQDKTLLSSGPLLKEFYKEMEKRKTHA